MPNPGDTVSMRSQSSRVRRFAISDRLCRTDPHRLQRVVDAVEQQVELTSTKPPFLQRRTEFVDKLGNVARHGLGCRNRFGERLEDADEFRRVDKLERLAAASKHLVEAAADVGTEAQRERGARRCRQLPDTVEAEPPELLDRSRRKTQGRNRQAGQTLLVALGDRNAWLGVEARQCMRSAVSAGYGDPRRYPRPRRAARPCQRVLRSRRRTGGWHR